MKRALLLVALVAAAAIAQQGTVFREDVRLVRLLVTVKDAQDQLVGSLEKSDFTIFDSGPI